MNAWIAQTLLASTGLMLVVMALRPWRRYLGSPWIYAMWLLPALRLFLPPLPLLQADDAMAGAMVPPASATADDMPFMAIWLAGATLHFAWQMTRYLYFMHQARANTRSSRRHGALRIHYSAAVDGPVAGGAWRRAIFLPLDFRYRFDAHERRLALAHELMHHRRHDIPANLLAMLVLSLHWFNPIAHLAHRLFRADQELACDTHVMASRGDRHRLAYGRTLLKANGRLPVECCALSDVDLLKLRLRELATALPRSRRWLACMVMAGAGLAAVASAATQGAPMAGETGMGQSQRPAPLLTPANRAEAASATRSATPSRAEAAASVRPMRHAPNHVAMDLPASERFGQPAYLQQRRELGLKRSRAEHGSAAQAAASRGRPLIDSPPAG